MVVKKPIPVSDGTRGTMVCGAAATSSPGSRPGPVRFYFGRSFDYSYGGNEVPTMEFIFSDYDNARPTKSATEVVA
jgi:hypothetical protein